MTPRAWLGPGIKRFRSDPGSPSSAWGGESWAWHGARIPQLFPALVYKLGKPSPALSRHYPLNDIRDVCWGVCKNVYERLGDIFVHVCVKYMGVSMSVSVEKVRVNCDL